MDNLTPRMIRFAEEYVVDFDGPAAYRRAGFQPGTDDSARTSAHRLLGHPDVCAIIDRKRHALACTTMVKAAQLLEEVDALALSDMGDVLDFDGDVLSLKRPADIPLKARRAIASIKVKRSLEKKADGKGYDEVEVIEFKFWSKPDALRMALQRRGLLEPLTRDGEEKPCKVYLNFDPKSLLAPPQEPTPLPLPDAPIIPWEAPPT